jgi:hypothetical protein
MFNLTYTLTSANDGTVLATSGSNLTVTTMEALRLISMSEGRHQAIIIHENDEKAGTSDLVRIAAYPRCLNFA